MRASRWATRGPPGADGISGATPPILKALPPELFIDHGETQEMRWEGMADQSYLVPNERFFVRNTAPTPRIDVGTWRLRVEGSGVRQALELRYEELRALPSTTVVRAIECAGNGRKFFSSVGGREAEGTPWKLGGIGVAEWTGVRLREVLALAGLKPTAREVMPVGADEKQVRRPMPLAKALEDDTVLAFAMNGEPLPPDHGFPARVLVPGWVGIAHIKWVARILVAEEALFSQWNTTQYVLVGQGYPAEPPRQGPALSEQNVKSALELPWPAEIPAGKHLLRGRAWSGRGAIARVEVSVDDSAYSEARLVEPNIPRAWARWELGWDATPGPHTIRVRATDTAGNQQPDSVPFNALGYLYNGVVPHPVIAR